MQNGANSFLAVYHLFTTAVGNSELEIRLSYDTSLFPGSFFRFLHTGAWQYDSRTGQIVVAESLCCATQVFYFVHNGLRLYPCATCGNKNFHLIYPKQNNELERFDALFLFFVFQFVFQFVLSELVRISSYRKLV